MSETRARPLSAARRRSSAARSISPRAVTGERSTAAGGEHHAARLGSHQRGHLLPRLLDQTARGAALDVDGGRIAGRFQRGERGRARLLPQRRAGVPVKINTLGHGPGSRCGGLYPQTSAARATPFETLAFCPRTRVRKAPAATGRRLQSAPALAKIWNGSRYLRVLGDAVKRALR